MLLVRWSWNLICDKSMNLKVEKNGAENDLTRIWNFAPIVIWVTIWTKRSYDAPGKNLGLPTRSLEQNFLKLKVVIFFNLLFYQFLHILRFKKKNDFFTLLCERCRSEL